MLRNHGLMACSILLLLGCGEHKIETKLKDAVKINMKDPDSAKFRNTTIDPNFTYTSPTDEHLKWSLGDKKGPEPSIKEKTYKTELVCVEANGKNAYGAYAGFSKFCAYQYEDGTYTGFDVVKKEAYESAMKHMVATNEQADSLMAKYRSRGYLTADEKKQADSILLELKKSQLEMRGRTSLDYLIFIPDDSKK
jgi:hypothetical protein